MFFPMLHIPVKVAIRLFGFYTFQPILFTISYLFQTC